MTGSKDTSGSAGTKGTKVTKNTKGRATLRVESPVSPAVDAITYDIIGAAFEVHTSVGAGPLESTFRDALVVELRLRGHRCDVERRIRTTYKGNLLRPRRLDLVVDDCVLVEVKAVTRLLPVHTSQVLSYLAATGLRVALLLNFRVAHLRDGIHRFVR